jgi:serine/threonine protein phosphatase PrpC
MFNLGVAAIPRLCRKLGYNRASEDALYLFASAGGVRGGLADGVGSMKEYEHVDTTAYSRALIAGCFKAASKSTLASSNPDHVFASGCKEVGKAGVLGASTLLVFNISGAQELTATNLGDSSLLVLRSQRVAAHCERQLIAFDRPAQLGYLPGNKACFQTPLQSVAMYPFPLHLNDTVLCLSDGVTDNLFMDEIIELVKSGDSASHSALHIAQAAQDRAIDSSRDSPFSLLAKDNDVLWSAGGRLDDITVLCVKVGEWRGAEPEQPPPTLSPIHGIAESLLPSNAAGAKKGKREKSKRPTLQ